MKLLLSTALLLAALTAASWTVAEADAADTIVGVWKVLSCTSRDEETGVETKPWGENPNGLLMYTADGYMSGVGVAEDRSAPTGTGEKLTEERAKLFASMTAYAGRYTVEPDRVIHHVEVAWDPAWKGTEQIRYVTFEGDTILIRTPVIVSTEDGRKRTFTLHFQRLK